MGGLAVSWAMRISQRGLVWVGVGVLVQVVSMLIDRPIVVRWTSIPLGLAIVGIGVAIILWDLWKQRRAKGNPEESGRNKEDGSHSGD
jgi:hypothetical protein